MKSIISLLLLTGLFFTVGCHNKDQAKQLLEFAKKYSPQDTDCIETRARNTCKATILNYHPQTENGVVIKNNDPGNFTDYRGVDLTDFAGLENIMLYSRMSESGKAAYLFNWISNNTVDLEKDPSTGLYVDIITKIPFSEENSYIKDLELLGANIEESQNEYLGEILSTDYGLSVERSSKVARLITQYKKLSTKRSLTQKERNFFSIELLGTGYINAFDSITTGENFDDLLEKAANLNGTTPEAVSTILSDLFL